MKVRETEIELLRIVIMILIIITHLAVWGTAKTENATILQQTTAEITNAIIRWHVNVFVIITGYFGIKSRKSMLNIIIMSVFYTWFLYGEGGNLAASKIRNLECPSYEICLIDYGCGKFNRKIHIMEQYP